MAIENYIDIITRMENFADGILIVNKKGIIIYHKEYRNNTTLLGKDVVVGKSLFEVYPELNKNESTIFRALKYGETAYETKNILPTYRGVTIEFLDTTFPIKEKGEIIGAVSIAKYLDFDSREINVSSLTSGRDSDFYGLDDIIGESAAIKKLKQQILKVARTNSSVLIYGETGTGKELVSQSIHSCSKREKHPFISQNCAAIPNTLLESIFFGTKKGSYTGAVDKAGIFEHAKGGSVFLDEINSMDINMQAKLLKIIEEKKVTRIGDLEPKKVDVRIIAATNEDPILCMRNKKMREDMFYRLGSVQIYIPPLRDRKEDISILANHFIKKFNKDMDMNIKGISDEVYDIFMQYNWPGNVREFKNAIEGAFNFASSDIIELDDIPAYIKYYNQIDKADKAPSENNFPSISDNLPLKDAVCEFEKEYLLRRLSSAKNLSALANELDITRQSLSNKLKKYNINASELRKYSVDDI